MRRRWPLAQDAGEAAVVRISCPHIQDHPGAGHGQGIAPATTHARRVQSSGDTTEKFRHAARRLCSGDGCGSLRSPATRRSCATGRGHIHAYVGALSWPRRRQGEPLRSSETLGGTQFRSAQLRETPTYADAIAHAICALWRCSRLTRTHLEHAQRTPVTHGTAATPTAATDQPTRGKPTVPR